jgi:DNA-binding response OmpR family regulator
MKVLLVEENHIYIKLITTFLSDLGYEVITSTKIEEAYEKWVKEQPDVIISALIFQEESGIDLIHKVRKSISAKYTLIIVITSLKEKELLTEAILSGADEVLLKPFDIYELRSRLISGYRLAGIREQENEVVVYTLNQLFKYRNIEFNTRDFPN